MKKNSISEQTSIVLETNVTGEDYPQLSFCNMVDGMAVAVKPASGNNVFFAGISHGSSVIQRMIGVGYSEMVDLLTRAVNNRTRQRNFFRLQSSMYEGLITEDEFYKALEENENEYVVEEKEDPTPERIRHALLLCQGIMDVNNSEDLSTLFSFSSIVTDCELKKLDANGGIQ